eukprot:5323563-Pyramimonas_sp.AAC.1
MRQSGLAGHFSFTAAGPPWQAAQSSPPPVCRPFPPDGGAPHASGSLRFRDHGSLRHREADY